MRARLLIPTAAAVFILAACASGAPSSPAVPGASASGTGCADVSAPAAKSSEVSEPGDPLPVGSKPTVTFTTSCGVITIQLDVAGNPKTASSFAHLVSEGYYNQTSFHRVVPGFVIQGGDPAGNGTGGPPWKVVEAPPADTVYAKGVVAMAKTGAEAAGTSGSQFFIVTGDDIGLPSDYAVAGRVVSGQDVVDLIAAQGNQGSDGPPNKPVVLESAAITQ